MISVETLGIDWINHVSRLHKNVDKILVEKVIRGLYLLEQLKSNGLDFIFRGGTALMLQLPEPKRLSIDIDIIVPQKPANLETTFDSIVGKTDFLSFEEDKRGTNSNIDKAHFKFFYKPATNTRAEKEYVLLDLLFEESPYGEHLRILPIHSAFIQNVGEPVMVSSPTYEAILGDKLTAFAPNTTGVQYGRGKEIEIIKQLYDIGQLFDHVKEIKVVSEVFTKVAITELNYRALSDLKPVDVLEDIHQTSLNIATRGFDGGGLFYELQKGIQNIRNFIFGEPFHVEKAMAPAAKAAYLSALLRTEAPASEKYSPALDLSRLEIKYPSNTRLNKLKGTNPEAFFYWYLALNQQS